MLETADEGDTSMVRLDTERRDAADAVTIGVASAGEGCGATHFALLFANYLAPPTNSSNDIQSYLPLFVQPH